MSHRVSLFIACSASRVFFFFNDTATTEIYTLSLHDALPISTPLQHLLDRMEAEKLIIVGFATDMCVMLSATDARRSEEHTSELQSQSNLVCRLLLEKKKQSKAYLNQTYPLDDGPT